MTYGPKPLPTEDRFWPKVDKSGGQNACWIWIAGLTTRGYGKFRVGTKSTTAHSYSYKLVNGSVPEGYQLDHLCRNRICVNPAHLEVVTWLENQLRSELTIAGKNIRKTHCIHGHPFSGNNLHIGPKGYRRCKECGRLDAKNSYRRKHELTTKV